MVDVILIHPSYKLVGRKDNLRGKESLTPSLGLAYLAAYLKSKQIGVKIFDLRIEQISPGKLINILNKEKPSVVGLTAYTEDLNAAFATASIVKKSNKEIYVVIGGPHATALPIETLNTCSDLDAVIIGEGEITLYELVDAIQSNKSVSGMQGLAVRVDNTPILTEPRPHIDDLDILPFPDWSLFDLKKYCGLFYVSFSRGCPYRCYFCFGRYLGKTRFRQPKNVVDEIEQNIRRFNAKQIQFADATLSLNRGKTIELCNKIIHRGINKRVRWYCDTRADRMDARLFNLFKKAGCKSVTFGIESGDENLLKTVINKGETKEQMKNAVNWAKEAKIETRCHFIIGHTFETRESIQKTINFAKELDPDIVSFGLMLPLPGTEVRNLAEKCTGGLKLLHSDWSKYSGLNNGCMELDDIPLKELKAWQSKAYLQFYSSRPLKFTKLLFGGQAYNLRSLPSMLIYVVRNFVGRR